MRGKPAGRRTAEHLSGAKLCRHPTRDPVDDERAIRDTKKDMIRRAVILDIDTALEARRTDHLAELAQVIELAIAPHVDEEHRRASSRKLPHVGPELLLRGVHPGENGA